LQQENSFGLDTPNIDKRYPSLPKKTEIKFDKRYLQVLYTTSIMRFSEKPKADMYQEQQAIFKVVIKAGQVVPIAMVKSPLSLEAKFSDRYPKRNTSLGGTETMTNSMACATELGS